MDPLDSIPPTLTWFSRYGATAQLHVLTSANRTRDMAIIQPDNAAAVTENWTHSCWAYCVGLGQLVEFLYRCGSGLKGLASGSEVWVWLGWIRVMDCSVIPFYCNAIFALLLPSSCAWVYSPLSHRKKNIREENNHKDKENQREENEERFSTSNSPCRLCPSQLMLSWDEVMSLHETEMDIPLPEAPPSFSP